MKLTAAQQLALHVAHDAGKPIGTWKRASRHANGAAPAYVNFRAAESLRALGLVRLSLTGYAHAYYEVTCTAAGCAVLAEILDSQR